MKTNLLKKESKISLLLLVVQIIGIQTCQARGNAHCPTNIPPDSIIEDQFFGNLWQYSSQTNGAKRIPLSLGSNRIANYENYRFLSAQMMGAQIECTYSLPHHPHARTMPLTGNAQNCVVVGANLHPRTVENNYFTCD